MTTDYEALKAREAELLRQLETRTPNGDSRRQAARILRGRPAPEEVDEPETDPDGSVAQAAYLRSRGVSE